MLLATLCYLQRDNCTLMVHRNKKPGDIHAGKWNGLGGKFEPGESPEECVRREVREESGLEIVHPHLCGLLVFTNFKDNDWYVFVFTADQFTGELTSSSPEGTLRWVTAEEMDTLPLWPSDRIFFEWMKAGKFFSAKFKYAGEEMLGYEVAFH